MSRLIEDGALDDRRFASRFAHDKRQLSDWGPQRIKEALQARGMPADLIADALAEDSSDDQVERAVGILSGRPLDIGNQADQRKALGVLARKGFDAEIAWEAIRAMEREPRPSGANG